METKYTKNDHSYSEFDDSIGNFTETTNPFQKKSFSTEKPFSESASPNTGGKRPRIYKPLYSVRLR